MNGLMELNIDGLGICICKTAEYANMHTERSVPYTLDDAFVAFNWQIHY